MPVALPPNHPTTAPELAVATYYSPSNGYRLSIFSLRTFLTHIPPLCLPPCIDDSTSTRTTLVLLSERPAARFFYVRLTSRLRPPEGARPLIRRLRLPAVGLPLLLALLVLRMRTQGPDLLDSRGQAVSLARLPAARDGMQLIGTPNFRPTGLHPA